MKGENKKPLIGISCRRMDDKLDPWQTRQQGAIETMINAVIRGGGAPVLIPLIDDDSTLKSVYDDLDGILLVGGGDVNPRLYGEEPNVPLLNPDDALDRLEMPLIRWAVKDGKPLFGICRGYQIINVTLGGSLYQNIGSSVDTKIEHNESWLEHKPTKLIHEMTLTPDSRTAKALGTTHLKVNSSHHQAINKLGRGLKVVAVAPDGVVEGVESEGDNYLVGVQSHPEHMAAKDKRWQAVFTSFVTASAKFAKKKDLEMIS